LHGRIIEARREALGERIQEPHGLWPKTNKQ
jgi:hypothetical protein